MGGNRILVVDDDKEILKLLSKYLSGQGLAVTEAASLRQMDERLQQTSFDLVVLDIMLPDGSGLEVCRAMRMRNDLTPVILLTAMQEDVDRIIGLEMGADDYLPKPFNPRELLARIKAVLRRAEPPMEEARPEIYVFDGFTATTSRREVETSTKAILPLTGAEFDILRFFLDRPGRILSREEILEFTRGGRSDPFDRSVDVLMSRLRKKIRDAGGSETTFKTVRNGGYMLTAKVSVSR